MVQDVLIGIIISFVILFVASKLVLFGFFIAIMGLSLLFIKLQINPIVGSFLSFVVVWILFLNVNPYELDMNKLKVLESIPSRFLTKQGLLWNTPLSIMQGLQYPIILKPVRCTALSRGIIIVQNFDELKTLDKSVLENKEYMYQQYIYWKYEAGVLYEYGNVVSVVRKDGDDKIRAYCTKCTDLTFKISDTFKKSIKEAASNIPNFNVGRFDIRYENEQELQKGNFIVLEANGTLGFDLRKTTYNFIIGGSFTIRWILMRLLYGLYNMASLNGYNLLMLIHVMGVTVYNTLSCRDWEKLFALYT